MLECAFLSFSTGAAGKNSQTTDLQCFSEALLWKSGAWTQVFISEILFWSVFFCLWDASVRDTFCPWLTCEKWAWRTDRPWLNQPEGAFECLFHLEPSCCPDNVTDSSQCRPTAARRQHPHAPLPPLIRWPRPHHHHPPARRPLFAAGFLMVARQPPAAQTHGVPFMESPSCSRLDSPGRWWPLTPLTSRSRPSESLSAPLWIRRYSHTTN